MKRFWNWVRNEDKTRTLYLNGVIAEESWFEDEVTPAAFKEELLTDRGAVMIAAPFPKRSETPCPIHITQKTIWRMAEESSSSAAS